MGKEQRCGDDDEDLLSPLPKVDLIQILVQLPVKSLGRFKMVSKPWCALIESPFFIDLHTTFNSSSNKFGSFIVLASLHKCLPKAFRTLSEHSLIMLSSESVSRSGSVDDSVSRSGSGGSFWSTTGSNDQDDDQLVFKVDNNNSGGGGGQLVFKLDCLGFPSVFKFCEFSKKIIGSCNGLVCLYDSKLNEVSLWNPATRQFKILPNAVQIVEVEGPKHLVAFGFDVETKDYKVVLLTGFKSKFFRPLASAECLCRVQVYSLSTDSWRLLEGITCLPGDPFRYPSEVLYLNGSCFFMAHFFHTKQRRCIPENDRFIISFDLTKEIITPIQLPDHHRHQKLYLSCLGDKMALFTVCCQPPPRGDSYYPDIYELPPRGNSYYPEIYERPRGIYYSQICGCEDYNIWVLDECVSSSSSSVNKKSWRQLDSFQIEHQRPGEWSSPSCISNDGEFVLLETKNSTGLGKKMKLCNLATKEVKMDFLSCSRVMSKANAYKPSLVKWCAAAAAGTSSR